MEISVTYKHVQFIINHAGCNNGVAFLRIEDCELGRIADLKELRIANFKLRIKTQQSVLESYFWVIAN